MIFEYMTIKFIWWAVIGLLLIGFGVLGGIDLGVGVLLPFIGKTDEDRRLLLNSIGPTWEGNQVWFVTAGASIFAAWPIVYATAFSGLYFALMLVLLALILRPPGIDFRSKLPSYAWRQTWDSCLFISGFVPLLVFGVAFGNLLKGVPFHFDADMRPIYTGSFFKLLNPYALLAGLVSLSLLVMHAALFIQAKTLSPLNQRAYKAAKISGLIYLMSFAGAGIWTTHLSGLIITRQDNVNLVLTPLHKAVGVAPSWLLNYHQYPLLWSIPLIAFLSTGIALYCAKKQRKSSVFFSGISITATILTPAIALFPFLMPSSSVPQHSLTLWDVTSSHLTLSVMLLAIMFFLPLILAYTSWVYKVVSGRVEVIHKDSY